MCEIFLKMSHNPVLIEKETVPESLHDTQDSMDQNKNPSYENYDTMGSIQDFTNYSEDVAQSWDHPEVTFSQGMVQVDPSKTHDPGTTTDTESLELRKMQVDEWENRKTFINNNNLDSHTVNEKPMSDGKIIIT